MLYIQTFLSPAPPMLSSQVLRRGDGGFSAGRSLLKFYQNVSGHKKLHMRLRFQLPTSAQAKSIQLRVHLHSRCFIGRITNAQLCQSSIIMCMCVCVFVCATVSLPETSCVQVEDCCTSEEKPRPCLDVL